MPAERYHSPLIDVNRAVSSIGENRESLKTRLARPDAQIEDHDIETLRGLHGLPLAYLSRPTRKALKTAITAMSKANDQPQGYRKSLLRMHNLLLASSRDELNDFKRNWIHAIEQGAVPEKAQRHQVPVLEQAPKLKKKLARLSLRYMLSGIWAKSLTPHPQGVKLLDELVGKKEMGQQEADALLQHARKEEHWLDPNMMLNVLAEQHGLTREEVDIMKRMTHEQMRELVPERILRALAKRYPQLTVSHSRIFGEFANKAEIEKSKPYPQQRFKTAQD